ncbi:hypothetical protein B296_00003890 [Ensete ventricosum]|uniref:Uncharacterized protein n=1 Tax=Ensete ventricosum TaxID=4639 RepID=A0A427AQF5_ENSVE|nr:hypothetical protein B296_00003890 [Ensete ventricosum]
MIALGGIIACISDLTNPINLSRGRIQLRKGKEKSVTPQIKFYLVLNFRLFYKNLLLNFWGRAEVSVRPGSSQYASSSTSVGIGISDSGWDRPSEVSALASAQSSTRLLRSTFTPWILHKGLIGEREKEPPSGVTKRGFILTGEEVVCMLSLTSVVTSGIAESYSGTVGVVVWGEDMVRHAALMASEGRVRWCNVQTRPPWMLTVRGAPSNNNGWKARFLFVSRHRGWDFSVKWSADPVSNVPPNLSDEDTKLIGRLKGILSVSRAIRSLTEEWLVEAGLSPASRAASSIPDSAPPAPRAESGSTSKVQEIPIEEARGAPEVSCKRRGEDPISQRKKDWRKSPHKADRVMVKGKGPTDVSEEPMAPRQKLMLVREL